MSQWELNLLLLLRILEILSKENFRNRCDFVSSHLPFCSICPWVFQIYCWISTPTPPRPPHTPPLSHPYRTLFAQQLSHDNSYSAGVCFFFFSLLHRTRERTQMQASLWLLFWASGMPTAPASSLPTRTSATNSTQLQVKCHGIWRCSSPREPVRSPCLGILHLNFGGIHYCPSKAWLFSLYYSVFPLSCLFPLFPQSNILKQGGVAVFKSEHSNWR